ncbi:MAG: hypothetical protein U0R69_09225 [Gaiellales bacterium]
MGRIRRSWVLVAAVLGVAMLAGGAAAANEPFAFGGTKDGDMRFDASALVSAKAVQLMGGWTDDTQSCLTTRELTVEVLIDRVRNGVTTRRAFTKTGQVANCAEGGPNFGFIKKAKGLGMGCAGGGWRPGTYTFFTKVTDTATGIETYVDLQWVKTRACA